MIIIFLLWYNKLPKITKNTEKIHFTGTLNSVSLLYVVGSVIFKVKSKPNRRIATNEFLLSNPLVSQSIEDFLTVEISQTLAILGCIEQDTEFLLSFSGFVCASTRFLFIF